MMSYILLDIDTQNIKPNQIIEASEWLNVRKNITIVEGVYGFKKDDEFVYIGASGKIVNRVSSWIAGNLSYKIKVFEEFVNFIKENLGSLSIHLFVHEDYKELKAKMIYDFKPRFNTKGKGDYYILVRKLAKELREKNNH